MITREHIEEYKEEIMRLQLKGGDLNHSETVVLNYCNSRMSDYASDFE